MSNSGKDHSVRAAAQSLIRAIARFETDKDAVALRRGIVESTKPLLERGDLLSLGGKRQANHIDNSRYLYYDGGLSMTLDEFPQGKFIPPHDHGVWEAIVVVSGRLAHSVYGRVDDGRVEGHAQLRVTEDLELTPGDVTMVVPPNDIHSFKALVPDTFVITVVGGEYSLTRKYYRLDDNTYAVKTPRALRESGALA
jgi:predicted metal-dependent enzyme (double-stranded beta helix superfamily)